MQVGAARDGAVITAGDQGGVGEERHSAGRRCADQEAAAVAVNVSDSPAAVLSSLDISTLVVVAWATSWDRLLDTPSSKFSFVLLGAVIRLLPTASAPVVQVAAPTETACAAQPVIVLIPNQKVTVPSSGVAVAGAIEAIEAEKVTGWL